MRDVRLFSSHASSLYLFRPALREGVEMKIEKINLLKKSRLQNFYGVLEDEAAVFDFFG
jgi:hypothetical protein